MGGDHLWDALSAIGEIIGAVAVVVSIIYLAAQIRANTKTMRANAGFEATHSWATFNEEMAQYTDEQLVLITSAFTNDCSWDGLSNIERARSTLAFRALFQKLEGQYYLFKYGTLDQGIWKNRAQFASGLLQKPFFTVWWGIEKAQLVYSDEFVLAIEGETPLLVSANIMGVEDGST